MGSTRSQGLHCAGRGWHPEMGNKELKLPCKGQEWDEALPKREGLPSSRSSLPKAGLRPWTLAAQTQFLPGKDLAPQ